MVDSGPQVVLSSDGARLHLQHGPIDLIVECDGSAEAVASAQAAAIEQFDGLLQGLVHELGTLRCHVGVGSTRPTGPVARRMFDAVCPYQDLQQVTPMAAVAGSVADEIGSAIHDAAELDRWLVNNGGDIAFWTKPGQRYTVGIVSDPRRGSVDSAVTIDAGLGIGGVATSGRHGRSFSLGIADAVTVFAATAAQADAAATLIANQVDLGQHDQIVRQAANELDADTDLGTTLVTLDVGVLTSEEVRQALDNGLKFAQRSLDRGLISGAVLCLANVRAVVADESLAHLGPTVSYSAVSP